MKERTGSACLTGKSMASPPTTPIAWGRGCFATALTIESSAGDCHMFTPLLVLLALEPLAGIDWPALVQKPNEALPHVELGLRPLLVSGDGTKITSPAQWEQARRGL